jgi:glycerol-3-phosphate acyltransferase PlsY
MIVVILALCYLIGSIPEAWLIAKVSTGGDLRQMGSGNLGVTNTALSVARWAGFLVFLSEGAKGLLAVTVARALGGSEMVVAAGLLMAVIGTRWSIWMGWAGGRGNTAGTAGLLLIDWRVVVIYLVLWTLIGLVSHSAFKATRFSLILWPVIFGLVLGTWWYVLFSAALSLIYLQAQQPETDDHLLIKEQWPGLLAFLTAPRRRRD